jgi:hypothetical protein
MGRLFCVLTVNAGLETLMAEIWMGEEFRFMSETLADAVLPIATDPKLRVLGEISIPSLDAPAIAPPPHPEKARLMQGKSRKRGQKRRLLACLAIKRERVRRLFRRAVHCPDKFEQTAGSGPNRGHNNTYISYASTKHSGQLRFCKDENY